MTVFLDRHRIPALAAPNAVYYARSHILPTLMAAGVCIYEPRSKGFRPFTSLEAERKMVQKIYSWRWAGRTK
jgi:hypothetical protein